MTILSSERTTIIVVAVEIDDNYGKHGEIWMRGRIFPLSDCYVPSFMTRARVLQDFAFVIARFSVVVWAFSEGFGLRVIG